MKIKRVRLHRPERDRMLFKLLHRIRELTPTEATRGTSVAPQTIKNWRRPVKSGGTRYPQFTTMDLVARANGLHFVLAEINEVSQTRGASESVAFQLAG